MLLVLTLLAAPAAISADETDLPRAYTDPLATLQDSDDPDELVAAAEEVCNSLDVSAIDQLVGMLNKPSLQDRLDSRRDFRGRQVQKLHVTAVLLAVARLPDGLAESFLGACARDPCFMRRPQRVRALIYAAAEIHNPSPYLLRFLDDQGAADGSSSMVVRTLGRLATDDSCALIEKRLASRDYGPYSKTAWLYECLPPVRDHPAVVAMYKRLLANETDDERLREALVRSLFDERPRDRYDYGSSEETPPPWRTFPTPVLEELLRVAADADKLDVSGDAKMSVERARKEIEAILADRRAEKER